VYFSDVVVRADHPARQLSDLVGSRWAYNDRTSLSGWFSVADLLEQAAQLIDAGSHLRSIELVRQGDADAAAIDSTVLTRLDGQVTDGLRIVGTRGPWPIHPMVVSASLPESLIAEMANGLLTMHEDPLAADQLRSYGIERWAPVDETDYLGLALATWLP
jgi:phosphonate transport system substrate-binding protein